MIKLAALLLVLMACQASIYERYRADAQKIAQAMTLDQKLGQILQIDLYAITQKGVTDPNEALTLNLGSLLVAGNGAPTPSGNMASLPGILE